MEMLFLTAPPSLLWPDGIRERSEAVKANTSKRERRGKGRNEGGGQRRRNEGEKKQIGRKQAKKLRVGILRLKQRKDKLLTRTLSPPARPPQKKEIKPQIMITKLLSQSLIQCETHQMLSDVKM